MICPHCSKSIHFESIHEMNIEIDNEYERGVCVEGGFCPSCHELIIRYYEGDFKRGSTGNGYIINETNEQLLYPFNKSRSFVLDDVPNEYTSDYSEALLVLFISPKASAALSRRCLQRFFHSHLSIKKASLVKEIEEFLNTQQVPSYILDAVDAIRNIGNFAAHPLKDTSTGEVIEVEPGEAEWLLEVLELLFDFYFIYPKKLEKRKEQLNEKLKKLGKPIMK